MPTRGPKSRVPPAVLARARELAEASDAAQAPGRPRAAGSRPSARARAVEEATLEPAGGRSPAPGSPAPERPASERPFPERPFPERRAAVKAKIASALRKLHPMD